MAFRTVFLSQLDLIFQRRCTPVLVFQNLSSNIKKFLQCGTLLYNLRTMPAAMKVCDLRSFLGNPNQGGGPEDLWVAAGLQTFVQRHAHVFAYDEANQRLSLRASFGPRCSSSFHAVCFPLPFFISANASSVIIIDCHHLIPTHLLLQNTTEYPDLGRAKPVYLLGSDLISRYPIGAIVQWRS